MINVLEDYRDMRTELKEMKSDIRAILEMVQNVRGGWKVAAVIGTAGMAVGGALVKFVPLIAR